jgi:hypothetical protein
LTTKRIDPIRVDPPSISGFEELEFAGLISGLASPILPSA